MNKSLVTMRLPARALVLAVLLLWSLLAGTAASARDILFVGNSFTFGANSPVRVYRADSVTDLNREKVGGVPALFKAFADEARLDWTVSLETVGGTDLAFHLAEKRALLDRRWDVVVLQGYSTLDAARPGDATRHIAAARSLVEMFRKRNPRVQVYLVATWSRADLTYRPGSRWSGQPIARMADDLYAASQPALAAGVQAIVPVGTAWNRAMREGLADPDPYDGIAFGQVTLWSHDHYHASSEGYYLTAATVFGVVTGRDPRTLGTTEVVAEDLGFDPGVAARMRAAAAAELVARGVSLR